MALLTQTNSTIVPRSALQEAFPGDPRLQLAVEQALLTASQTPDAVNAFVDASLLLTAPSDELENARVLVPGSGVSFDNSTPGLVIVNVFVQIDATTLVTGLRDADDDAAAAALVPPVPIGGFYLNGSVPQVRRA